MQEHLALTPDPPSVHRSHLQPHFPALRVSPSLDIKVDSLLLLLLLPETLLPGHESGIHRILGEIHIPRGFPFSKVTPSLAVLAPCLGKRFSLLPLRFLFRNVPYRALFNCDCDAQGCTAVGWGFRDVAWSNIGKNKYKNLPPCENTLSSPVSSSKVPKPLEGT